MVLSLLITSLILISFNQWSLADDPQSEGYCTQDGDSSCKEPMSNKYVPSRPNVILMLADDLGYGDLASYGNPIQEPGALDRMAHEGLRFTQFYSADSMCSPSRVGLLTGKQIGPPDVITSRGDVIEKYSHVIKHITGRLPIRSGIVGGRRVFVDFDTGGLPQDELTIAEALRDLGYATGFVGKWHLGINSKTNSDGVHLPHAHGFDFVGHNLPLTDLWQCDESRTLMKKGPDRSKCYVYNGKTIVQQPIAHSALTNRFLDDFRLFLNKTVDENPEKPFFFFFSFHQVHTSLETAPKFSGASKRGPFGDSVLEMQDAVGQILDAIRSRSGLPEKTLVIFMSDHGPHKEACTYGGSTGGLRGGKGNSFEGGIRVPAIAYWPTVIEAGTISDAILSSLDILPSLVALAGGQLPEDRVYDGLEAHEALVHRNEKGTLEKLEKRTLFFYCNEKLTAVRHRNLKFHLMTSPEISKEDIEKYCPNGGRPVKDGLKAQMCFDGDMQKHDPPLAYDLHKDPFEMYALDQEKVAESWEKVKVLVQKHKKSIKAVEKQLGKFDPKVIPCCDRPKCECNYP